MLLLPSLLSLLKFPIVQLGGNPNKNDRGVCHTLFLLVKIKYMYLYLQGG